MSDPISIFIFAGEMSGDRYGADLILNLPKQLDSPKNCHFLGVGGPRMRSVSETPFKCLIPMEEFQVMGFSAVVGALPRMWRHFRKLAAAILHQNPAAVVLIDYPVFNLKLAKVLRRKGFRNKIIQYISPSVWAHSPERIDIMAQHLDLLLSILPFESSYFSHTKLPVTYIGHPLLDIIKHYQYNNSWMQHLGFDLKPNLYQNSISPYLIGLFPGSRPSEIKHHLPRFLQAAELIKTHTSTPVCFGLSLSNPDLLSLVESCLTQTKLQLGLDLFIVPKQFTYELMRDCRSAIAKGGTVTLELGLHQKPTIVAYHLTQLNRWMAQYWLKLKLPHYCLVNILLQKRVFPELIENGFSAQSLYEQFKTINEEGSLREECLKNCSGLLKLLEKDSAPNSSEAAAQAIANLI